MISSQGEQSEPGRVIGARSCGALKAGVRDMILNVSEELLEVLRTVV